MTILSSNIFFAVYDETYGVIYGVIMRKFRVSMEPFWDLKFVEYLALVSSEYLTSSVLPSLTSIR